MKNLETTGQRCENITELVICVFYVYNAENWARLRLTTLQQILGLRTDESQSAQCHE